jgi:hypothetical protein
MNQVLVAVHTTLFIARSWIKDRPVSEHGSSSVRNVKNIAMTFLALIVLEGGISLHPVFVMIIFLLHKMNNDVFDAVGSLRVEKVEGMVWGGQMTVHTVGHKSLRIIRMCGGFPGVVSKLNFMAGCAELGRGSPDHGVIGDAE